MFQWIVKKVICGKVNDLLKEYQGNINVVRKTLKTWIERLRKVLGLFESIMAKVDDNELSSDEVKEAVDEFNKLVKEW